jgi:hypothetical protein
MATVVEPVRTLTPPSPHALLRRSPLVRPARLVARLTLLLVAVGLACRVLRYALHFPLWGDEAFLCMNFLDRDYVGLTKKLDNVQVAPVLFLWGELTAYKLLGGAEWVMRLLPFIASVGGLLLFWRMARLTLAPLAVLFAVGVLAVARWPVTMGAVVKPYSFDLFFSLALMVPAVCWLRRPEQRGWLVLLVALVPLALASSYPSVFVAGAVSLTLLPTVWQRRGVAVCSLYVAYNVLMFATFLTCLRLVGSEQLTGNVGEAMRDYWSDGFPPADPLGFIKWLALINTGRVMAYPVGESNGGSTVTFLLFLAGVWHCWTSGRRQLLVLLLTPFALNLFAAIIQRYPYGGCCRLSQHLAPAVCLLAGAGAASLLERFVRRPDMRVRWTYAVTGLLILCGGVAAAYDLAHPYRNEEAVWARKVGHELGALAGPKDCIVVALTERDTNHLLRWQLSRLGNRLSWGGAVDAGRVEADGGRIWLVSPWLGEGEPLDQLPDTTSWVRLNGVVYSLRESSESAPPLRCTVSCWAPANAPGPRPLISCWP